ncbi:MAG TPA: hypothetical protein VGQ51_13770 [Puia sp.]|nr:hypothetical protein [Puia sp.]
MIVPFNFNFFGFLFAARAFAEALSEDSIPPVPSAAVPATMVLIAVRREDLLDILLSTLKEESYKKIQFPAGGDTILMRL